MAFTEFTFKREAVLILLKVRAESNLTAEYGIFAQQFSAFTLWLSKIV